MAQSFGSWLKAQRDRNDPVGDLAQDFLRDVAANQRGWPSQWSAMALRHRLMFLDACDGAMAALDQAVAEWQASR
jgi:hypothetical protein